MVASGLHWVDIDRVNNINVVQPPFSQSTFYRSMHSAAPYIYDIMAETLAKNLRAGTA